MLQLSGKLQLTAASESDASSSDQPGMMVEYFLSSPALGGRRHDSISERTTVICTGNSNSNYLARFSSCT